MTAYAVSNTIKDAVGNPLAGVKVDIVLRPVNGFKISDHQEVAPQTSVTTDITGTWTASLESNLNITPDGTYYEVQEHIPPENGGARQWIIRVLSAPGTVYDLLLAQVLAVGQVANFLTQEIANQLYALKGDPNAIGYLIRYGIGAPSDGLGANNDFYIDALNWLVYGPKANGVWPVGVSMIGPTGSQGDQGPQGIQGIQGPTGPAGNFNLTVSTNPATGTPSTNDLWIQV